MAAQHSTFEKERKNKETEEEKKAEITYFRKAVIQNTVVTVGRSVIY